MENGRDAEQLEIRLLEELSPLEWRSGIAAWLGWPFRGLDMRLYTLAALLFVAQLLGVATRMKT